MLKVGTPTLSFQASLGPQQAGQPLAVLSSLAEGHLTQTFDFDRHDSQPSSVQAMLYTGKSLSYWIVLSGITDGSFCQHLMLLCWLIFLRQLLDCSKTNFTRNFLVSYHLHPNVSASNPLMPSQWCSSSLSFNCRCQTDFVTHFCRSFWHFEAMENPQSCKLQSKWPSHWKLSILHCHNCRIAMSFLQVFVGAIHLHPHVHATIQPQVPLHCPSALFGEKVWIVFLTEGWKVWNGMNGFP